MSDPSKLDSHLSILDAACIFCLEAADPIQKRPERTWTSNLEMQHPCQTSQDVGKQVNLSFQVSPLGY